MEVKVIYDGRGILNEVTESEIIEHLVQNRGTLKVWYNKKEYYVLYKIRYKKLYKKNGEQGNWEPADSVQIHKYSTLDFLH